MATQTDTTLRAYVDAARFLGGDVVRRAFDALRAYAQHDDDVAEAMPHVVVAIAPTVSTLPNYAPVAIPVAVRTALANVASNRRRAHGIATPTEDTYLVGLAETPKDAARIYWEDARASLSASDRAALDAAISAHLTRKDAHARLSVILASGPALKVTPVADAYGIPTDAYGKRSTKQNKQARVAVCAAAASAFATMGTGRRVRYVGPATKDGRVPTGPAETVQQRAARAEAWVRRAKGSAPTMAGEAVPFIDGRNPLATGPAASLGYRPQSLAKTGSARRDAPVKVRSSVATGLTFGGGAEVGEVGIMYAPGDVCPTPVDVPCGCVGACDCAPVRVCGCERPRQTLTDGRGILCHRARVLATTEARRAKVASAVETTAETASDLYDGMGATWDAATGTHRIMGATAKPCPTPLHVVAIPFAEGTLMCRCGARRGSLVVNADGIPCHKSQGRATR